MNPGLSNPRISIEARHVWSIALALLFHVFILGIFSVAMPWLKTQEIPESKISSRLPLAITLISASRDLPVDREKNASVETKLALTDEVAPTAPKEKTAERQPQLEAISANKKDITPADVNSAQEKNAIDSTDKKNAEKVANELPTPNDVDDQDDADDWMNLVKAKIVASSEYFPSSLEAEVNAAIKFDVQLQADGSILTVEKLSTSGNPKFDDAILKAVKDLQLDLSHEAAKVPSHFTFAIHMADLLSKRSHNRLSQMDASPKNG